MATHSDWTCSSQEQKSFPTLLGRQKKAPGLEAVTVTGIGVYCQIQETNYRATVFIQATVPIAPSILEVEAEAFSLKSELQAFSDYRNLPSLQIMSLSPKLLRLHRLHTLMYLGRYEDMLLNI
jgi:hypothetical protein